MSAITKLEDNKAANKHDEVVLASHAEDVHFSDLKVFLKKIFEKVDESITRTNIHTSDFQTPEMIQDIVGTMFSNNTETGISATYADNGASAGKIDLAVTSILVDEDDMSSDSTTLAPTQQSVKAYVDASISGLVDSAPGALNTLNELAAALNDDASFSTTVTNSLATKAPKANPTFTGTIAIPNISNLESAVSNNTSKVSNATHTGDVTGATSLTIANDAVTYAKMQNMSDNRVLGRYDEGDSGAVTELNASTLRAMLNVADNANNYSHPTGNGNNHIPSNGSAGQFLKYSSAGTAVWAADNNTTYSVGDGGLTQNNFTDTLKNKLDGIASGAEQNVQSDWNSSSGDNQILNKPTIPVDLTSDGTGTVHPNNYTNTTYSVGDGGLTTNDFTNDDHTKLNGIETGAQVNVSGNSGNAAIYDNSGTPALKTGISANEIIDLLGVLKNGDVGGNDTFTGTLTIDRNKAPAGITANYDGLLVDYDRTNTPSSGVDLNTGINIDMDLAGATSAGIQMATGVQSIITFSAHGGAAVVGSAGYFECIGGDAGNNIGIGIKTEGVGPDIKIYSNDNNLDYCAIYTETNGATTIKTVDADSESAHLTINPKGNLILAPELGYIKIVDSSHTAFELKNINDLISKLTLNAAGWITFDETDNCGISKHPTTDRLAVNVGGHMLLDLVESASTSTGQSSYAAVSGVVRLGPTGGVADTPPTNYGALYNNGGVLYYKNDAGTVTNLLAGGGGGGTSYWNWQQSMRWYTRYNNWYAPNATYGPAYYNWTQQWSSTPPTTWGDSSNTMIVVPKNMTITSYHIHGNFTGASTYELHIKKGTPSYGTNGNTSLSQLGSTQSLVVGTSNMNVKIEETGLSVSLSAGDIIIPFLRRSANNTSSYYFFEGVLNIMGEYA